MDPSKRIVVNSYERDLRPRAFHLDCAGRYLSANALKDVLTESALISAITDAGDSLTSIY
jgi:hypothetical protein